jgi:crotonobetainyl-CoA:carnitine CoA-transferase CaiB-like acyl-CoA transferase
MPLPTRWASSSTTCHNDDRGRRSRPAQDAEPVFRLSGTPGSIRHGGRRLGQETRQVLAELADVNPDQLDALRDRGII